MADLTIVQEIPIKFRKDWVEVKLGWHVHPASGLYVWLKTGVWDGVWFLGGVRVDKFSAAL